MEIIFSQEFADDYKKIKDNATRLRIIKQIRKLEQQPDAGKPLKHELKSHRSLRVPPFRIIYRIEQNRILINCFEHRDKVYR